MPSVNKILKSAKNSSKSPRAKKAIDQIEIFDEIAAPNEKTQLALGEWDPITRQEHQFSDKYEVIDDTPKRVKNILEKKGFKTDSSTNWIKCPKCNRPIQKTQNNQSSVLIPYMTYSEKGYICLDCTNKKELIKNLIGGGTFSHYLDLKKYDYRKVKQHFLASEYPNHFLAKELNKYGITNFIFNLEKKKDQDIEFSIWIHKKEVHKAPSTFKNINQVHESIQKLKKEEETINDLQMKIIKKFKDINEEELLTNSNNKNTNKQKYDNGIFLSDIK